MIVYKINHWLISFGGPYSKVYGTNMGPTLDRQDPGGLMLATWTLLFWGISGPKFDVFAMPGHNRRTAPYCGRGLLLWQYREYWYNRYWNNDELSCSSCVIFLKKNQMLSLGFTHRIFILFVWVWGIIHKERCCCDIYVMGLHSIWSARRKSDTSGRDKPAEGACDVIKWKHSLRYWPFLWGIPRSPVNFPHKGQRRGALMFSLICTRINGWVNTHEAGDLRCYRAHYDVTVMVLVVRANAGLTVDLIGLLLHVGDGQMEVGHGVYDVYPLCCHARSEMSFRTIWGLPCPI